VNNIEAGTATPASPRFRRIREYPEVATSA
jgi:hypothetical protein